MVIGTGSGILLVTMNSLTYKILVTGDYTKIMEKVLLDLRKTVKDFNRDNQEKGFKVKYHVWNRTHYNVLCQVVVTRVPDKVTKDKFILLDLSLDVQDEISYFINDIITSSYKLS